MPDASTTHKPVGVTAMALTRVPVVAAGGLRTHGGRRRDVVILAAVPVRLIRPSRPYRAWTVVSVTRTTGARTGQPTGWDTLTETRRLIACLLADGLSNQQVATRLHLGVNTIKYHVKAIYAALDIHSRVRLSQVVGRRDV